MSDGILPSGNSPYISVCRSLGALARAHYTLFADLTCQLVAFHIQTQLDHLTSVGQTQHQRRVCHSAHIVQQGLRLLQKEDEALSRFPETIHEIADHVRAKEEKVAESPNFRVYRSGVAWVFLIS